MLKIFIIANVSISISMSLFIFYSYAGISGGDIAIISSNIMFGLFQLLTNSIYLRIKKLNFNIKIQLTIAIMQIIELFIFLVYGYQINIYVKSNYC